MFSKTDSRLPKGKSGRAAVLEVSNVPRAGYILLQERPGDSYRTVTIVFIPRESKCSGIIYPINAFGYRIE